LHDLSLSEIIVHLFAYLKSLYEKTNSKILLFFAWKNYMPECIVIVSDVNKTFVIMDNLIKSHVLLE
jgi:uncharacterized protein YdeI (YjbR/CyaY-like superfamily)